jgi:2-oxopent-4-enoate/cis-2-oxohex-4-enoate hydratase
MTIHDSLLQTISLELYNAQRQAEAITPLTERYPELTLVQAYGIQQHLIARRMDDGERVAGKKIGVTSQAVMNLLGVGQPDFGILTDAMMVNSGEVIATSSLIQPKAEGELAFVLKHDLMGPGITVADVLRATEGVMVCFEIVDSRIQDWKIKIQDTVADNASCGVFVLSDRLVPLDDVDLQLCGMVLEKNGEIVATGAGAASMGSPAVAVAWLANTLGHLGVSLKAGEVILSGSLGPMIPVKAGDNLRVSIGGVGSCSVRFS